MGSADQRVAVEKSTMDMANQIIELPQTQQRQFMQMGKGMQPKMPPNLRRSTLQPFTASYMSMTPAARKRIIVAAVSDGDKLSASLVGVQFVVFAVGMVLAAKAFGWL